MSFLKDSQSDEEEVKEAVGTSKADIATSQPTNATRQPV